MKHDDSVQQSSSVSRYWDFHKTRFRNFGVFYKPARDVTNLNKMKNFFSLVLRKPKILQNRKESPHPTPSCCENSQQLLEKSLCHSPL